MRGRTQHISLDAEARGVRVSDEEGSSLGEAPLFYRVNSASSLTFTLTHQGRQHKESVSCEFQWLQTPLENSPLALLFSSAGAPVAFGVYGVALLIDLLTGAAYHCPERVIFSAPPQWREPSPAPHYCPRFLHMSDTSLSQRSQAEVLERWWTLRSTGAGERCERPHMIKD